MSDGRRHTEMMQERGGEPLYKSVAHALAEAVRRAMRVAGTDDDGGMRHIKQVELAQRAGMSRSKLGRVISPTDEDLGKVDVRTICTLAEELGVPPAFLLLRQGDWQALGLAINQFAAFCDHPKIEAWRERWGESKGAGPVTAAIAATELASEYGLLANLPKDTRQEVLELVEDVKRSIATTSALAPVDARYAAYFTELVTLCVFAGYTARSPSGTTNL